MMEELRKRITNFWKGHLSKQEQRNLLEELQEKEEDLQAMLAQDFESENPEKRELLSDSEYRQLLTELQERMLPASDNSRKVVLWRRALIAAAVLLIGIGTSILAWKANHPQVSTVASTHTGQDTIHLVNKEKVDKQAVLADGSIVILSPGSALSYPSDYGANNRELHLRGQGRFSVVRDASRPFVVWANGYTTTALGTEFTIDTRHADRLHIQLLSGKIVVKSTSSANLSMVDQYLFPGDQLEIQTRTGTLALTKQKKKTKQPKPEDTSDSVIVPAVAVMKFEDTPLQTVFETVARHKGTPIFIEENLLTGLSFTGEFRDDESLQAIVSVICQMNNLTYTETGEHIHIQQKQNNTIEEIKKSEIQIK
ncbi:FecR family protein [Sphingobacterium gobiense]|uniref:FecR protein domain-containing protein n=1 Tax=Sphingobacterium gobiense TaxID=1382456 RepID=A0A2S9JG61_9SPHI|nr:FecR domain-containing protein [Sphingobacterium gobiense]PRD51933.1 hypothetical protein C5749_16670 [Sphingobacterium gobiense]